MICGGVSGMLGQMERISPPELKNMPCILVASITRIPLVRGEEPILRSYCAFWKKDNSGCCVEEFARILKAQFEVCSDTTAVKSEG